MVGVGGGGAAKISTILADADLDMGAQKILVDTIDEKTPTAGVTIDTALIKDGSAAGKVSNFTVDANLDMGAHDLLTDDIKESTGAHGVDIDGVAMKDDKIRTIDSLDGSVIPKKVSDNLRNSHDAEITDQTGASYVKQKTITFTYGIKGTLRIKYDIHTNNGTYSCYGAVYKNGVLLGTPSAAHFNTAYETESEDIDVGTIAAGETLELWGKAEHGSALGYWEHFRCYYDNEGSAATGANS